MSIKSTTPTTWNNTNTRQARTYRDRPSPPPNWSWLLPRFRRHAGPRPESALHITLCSLRNKWNHEEVYVPDMDTQFGVATIPMARQSPTQRGQQFAQTPQCHGRRGDGYPVDIAWCRAKILYRGTLWKTILYFLQLANNRQIHIYGDATKHDQVF